MWKKLKTRISTRNVPDTHTHTQTAWVWSWCIFLGHHLAEWLDKFFPISEEAFEVAPVIGWMSLWICDFPCWQLMHLKLASKMWWNNLSSESHYDSLVLEAFSAVWNGLNQQIEFTRFVVRMWTIKLCISLSTSRTFGSKIQLDRSGPEKRQLTHNHKTQCQLSRLFRSFWQYQTVFITKLSLVR